LLKETTRAVDRLKLMIDISNIRHYTDCTTPTNISFLDIKTLSWAHPFTDS